MAHPVQPPISASARNPSPDTAPAARPSPQMLMLLASVKQARLYAVAAVNADLAGDYAAAAANYRAAVKSLKNEVANVPPEDSQAFTDRVCVASLPPNVSASHIPFPRCPLMQIVMYERRAELIELHKLGTAAIEGTLPVEDTTLPVVRPCKDVCAFCLDTPPRLLLLSSSTITSLGVDATCSPSQSQSQMAMQRGCSGSSAC